ncbi:DUF4136 domain-containing protein [Sphingomonas sp. GlSt437]|uniref:DUF4136 domain-containing protein n=2 Tax=Bacteria TaxID=2 RepID=UPI003A8AE726
MRRLVLVATAAAALSLTSCADSFSAKVSRFQALPAPAGQTFAVEPGDPRLRGGLEFNQYANLVAARLTEKGYHEAAPGTRPDLIVSMSYSVDHGREKVESWPRPYPYGPYGRFYGGFGYRPYYFGFYDPFGFDRYDDVRSYTVYTSELDLQIKSAADGHNLFEGTAKAVSTDDELPHLVPNLVAAMFTGFPGNSGETVKITIPPQKH